MKKFLSRFCFCSIILLSAVCFKYVNTVDLNTENHQMTITEVQQTNDKLIGSVKAVTVVFSKVFDLLANRGEA